MGLFSKLKGKKEDFSHLQDGQANQGASSSSSSHQPPNYDYAPPPGPPPMSEAKSSNMYSAPSGPPPDFSDAGPSSHNWDAPPSGPPPDFSHAGPSYHHYAPPPGPPPTLPGYVDYSSMGNTTPHHNPDAPPPGITQWASPTSNASFDDAARGHEFCRLHPIAQPVYMTPEDLYKKVQGDFGIQQPLEFLGEVTRRSNTITNIKSRPKNPDALLLSSFPVYSVVSDQPREKDKKVIYYEVKIISLGRSAGGEGASVAIGYTCVPYPAWRLPGWHRGSLGVHSDDGRRYVNDSYGGTEFTSPFKVGDTVGVGMRFRMGRAEVFFVRNGVEGGGWWIDEEVDLKDQQAGGVDGLQGESDLYASIGIFGEVEVEVDFGRKEWSD